MRYPKIIPLWDWVYVRKEQDDTITKDGIVLPNNLRIPNNRATVLAVGDGVNQVLGQDVEVPSMTVLDVGDMVLLHYASDYQPIEVEAHRNLLLVPVECCIAIVGRNGRLFNDEG